MKFRAKKSRGLKPREASQPLRKRLGNSFAGIILSLDLSPTFSGVPNRFRAGLPANRCADGTEHDLDPTSLASTALIKWFQPQSQDKRE
jgi:hypothetical protein